MKKEIGCLLIILSCSGFCAAQQVVSSGGYNVKSDISVNWILGGSLMDIPACNLSTIKRLQSEQLMESEISLKVYPNPASDFINVEITRVDTGRLILELFNDSGVKVLDHTIANQSSLQVNIDHIPSGAYFLKVLSAQKDKLFRVEKIIKK
jgi:hypothetical protein